MATVIFYNLIFFSSTFFVWLSEKGRTYLDRWVLLFIAFLIIFLPSALRYGIGADYFNYLNIYQNESLLELYKVRQEYGFYYINIFLRSINAHFQWSFAVFAFLFSFAAFKAYPRKQAWLLHLTFFVIFYFLSFFIIRNAIAVGLSLWALHVFLQGRNIQFFVLIAAAALFHKSAVIIGLLGFLSLIPIHTVIKTYVFPIVGILVLVITAIKPTFLFFLIEKLLLLLHLNSYAGYFNNSLWFSQTVLGTGIIVLVRVLFVGYFLSKTKQILKQNSKNWFLVLSLFLYGLGTVLSAHTEIFGRFTYIFIFSVPYAFLVLYKTRSKLNKLVVICTFIILFLGINKTALDLPSEKWGERPYQLNPYQTIFNISY